MPPGSLQSAPAPPRCCTLNCRRWQSLLFPHPRHLPTRTITHPLPTLKMKLLPSHAGPESGASHADLQPGPRCACLARDETLIRLLTAARGRAARQTVNLGKVNGSCGGPNAPYRLAFACQETVCRHRQDLFAPRASLSWLSVPR